MFFIRMVPIYAKCLGSEDWYLERAAILQGNPVQGMEDGLEVFMVTCVAEEGAHCCTLYQL